MSSMTLMTTSENAPEGARALARPRLFDAINQHKRYYATWLIAAGGYGKTTLAISYAHHQSKPIIWLLIPEAGISTGEFFFKLRQQTINVIGLAGKKLPILNPEYSSSAEVFVRQFAETLATCVNKNAILLVDDMHHVPTNDALQSLIALFIRELAGKVHTLITSRHEPSAPWITLRSRGLLAFIDEGLLNFSAEESVQLLTREGLPENKINHLLPQLDSLVGGWPVALMLLLEHWQRTATLPDTLHRDRSLNDWFMYEIYLPLTSKDKQVLRYCSQPSLIPSVCVNAATGINDASQRLERLAQEHAFIFIAPNTEGGRHYRFHDLFKDFLRQQFIQEDDPSTQHRITKHWATTLWQEGFWELSAPLLIQHKNWEALAHGISQIALELLQSGRGDKLYALLAAIPEKERRSQARSRLWEGVCLTLVDTVAARELMASAWEELTHTEDYLHLALAWSGIVDSIWLEWAHVSLYERWITEFERFENVFREHLPPPLWHAVLRGIVTAISYGRPLDPTLASWEREALATLSSHSMTDNDRVMLASQLMYVNTWQFGRRAGASQVMAIMQNQQDAIDRSSPLAQCLWKTFTALWALLYETDKTTCLAEAEIGRELIRNYGIGTWDSAVPALHCALVHNDPKTLDNWVAWFMRTEPKTHRPFYDTFQAHFLSAQAWVKHELPLALSHAKEATIVADKHGSIAISVLFHGIYAGLLAETGNFKESLLIAKNARQQKENFKSDFLDIGFYLNLAKIPLHRKQPKRALPYLRLAFAAGSRQRIFFPAFINDSDLAKMCGLMLTDANTKDYALWHIETRGLIPPTEPDLRQHWPWFARLNVLGQYSLHTRDGTKRALTSGKQGTNKLLSHLIIAGPRGIAQENLALNLWPDSDTENALNSLYVTLHRLRKNLFGEASAIITEEGRVRFNPKLVQVDAWEFLALAHKPERHANSTLQEALDLYQGAAQLPGIDEIDADIWRLSLSNGHEGIAHTLAKRLTSNAPSKALVIYRQGLEQSPLSSPLWQGVLKCEAILGNQHALIENYRLLTKRFEQELGLAPPKELQELFQVLVPTKKGLL